MPLGIEKKTKTSPYLKSSKFFHLNDDLPTRDIGPDRLIGHSSNHSEIGIPISTPQDNRSRYVSRVSINGKEVTTINSLPGANDYRSSSTSHNALPLRYQSNNWKNGR